MKLCRYDDNRIGLVRGPPCARRHRDPRIAAAAALSGAVRRSPDRQSRRTCAVAWRSLPTRRRRVRSMRCGSSARWPTRRRSSARRRTTTPMWRKRAATPRSRSTARASSGPSRSRGLFLKASSSLIGPSEGVAVRFPDRRTDHEAELGVVIGRKTGFVSEAEALERRRRLCDRARHGGAWQGGSKLPQIAGQRMRCSGRGW